MAEGASEAAQKQFNPALPSVLCLSRTLFDKDITDLRRHAVDYNWISYSAASLAKQQKSWLPAELEQQATYALHHGEIYDEAWRKSTEHAECILNELRSTGNVVAVMAANFDYGPDEGMRRACIKLGIPFLALMREHFINEANHSIMHGAYKNHPAVPNIAGVAVAGKRTRDLLINCNLFKDDQAWVTGWPRHDGWIELLQQKTNPADLNLVVLLTYLDPGYQVGDHFLETLASFLETFIRHGTPSKRFVIKCKDADDFKMFNKVLASRLGSALAEKLVITYDTPLPILFSKARAIIGFNTAAMVEGLLSQGKLIIPQWGATNIDPIWQNLPSTNPAVRPHVTYARSKAEMNSALDKALVPERPDDVDFDARIKLFQQYFEFSETVTASHRVQAFVDHFVGRS